MKIGRCLVHKRGGVPKSQNISLSFCWYILRNTMYIPPDVFRGAYIQGGDTVYSGYNGHDYSGHSDIVATFPVTKYIYSIIFRSDIVANRI